MATGSIRLTWRDRNWAEQGHYIYRSDTPMDVDNLPSPITTVPNNHYEYIDHDVIADQTYYYRIGAFRNSDVSVSDEIEVVATPITYDIFDDQSAVSLFKFDGDTTDMVTGVSGTWVGNEQYINGKDGQAVKFDGSSYFELDSYVYGTLFDYNSVFSISFWVVEKFISFGFMNSNGNTGFFYTDFSDGTAASVMGTSTATGGNGNLFNQRNATPDFNAGDHIVLSKISNNVFEIYKNGTLLRTVTCATSGTGTSNGNYIGQWHGDASPTNRTIAKGALDHLRIFNRPVSANEAIILHNEFDSP